jgi:streptogramin lyase
MRRPLLLLGLLLAAAIAAGCGGGGGAGSALTPQHDGPVAGQSAHTTISVTIPGPSGSSVRTPKLITANTASFTLQVYTVDGVTPDPQPTPLSIQITNTQFCTTSSGSTTCSVDFPVPIATAVVVIISTYDANGNLLGEGFAGPFNSTLATIAPQTVVVGGVLKTILTSATALSAPQDGAKHTVSFTVLGRDSSGNTILPPGNYPAPITVSVSGDPNGALTPVTTTITSPGPSGLATVSVTYDSTKTLSGVATIAVNAPNATGTSVPFAALVYSPTSLQSIVLGASTDTVSISEAGYGGAFTVSSSSATVGSTTCVPIGCTPATTGGTVAAYIQPVAAGSADFSLSDANGATASIPFTVTSSSGGGGVVGAPYTVYEFTTSSGGANYGISVGPDGQSIWFADANNGKLGAVPNAAACVQTCSTIAETGQLPIPTSPPIALRGITAASDGKLYVADNGAPPFDLGYIYQGTCTATPVSCSFTTLPNPTYLATPAPYDVVAAPDGNLYASSSFTNSFTNGSILETPLAGCCTAQLNYFAASPVGATTFAGITGLTVLSDAQTMFFTDSENSAVGYFPIPCTYCVVTEQPNNQQFGGGLRRRVAVSPPKHRYRLPGAGSTFTAPLAGIVTGPDGYLYVAEPGSNRIDQIDPSIWTTCAGACTFGTIPIPTNASASPQNLAVGADGNVWFTDATGYIGQIVISTCSTGTCVVHEYATGGSPWGITAGPDGNIWFTDSSTNRIGKVVL